MNFTLLNKEIAKNKLEIDAEVIRDRIKEELKASCVDREELGGKTIKEVHKGRDSIALIFDDGTYFIIEAYDDRHDEGIIVCFPAVAIDNAHKWGLLSDEKYQVLKGAEKESNKAWYENEGVTHLNNAIANLGLDAVKTLVNA
jgi:regulator of replication initiation timing